MALCICRCVARVVGRSVARAVNWWVATAANCTLPARALAHGRGRGATQPQVSLSAPAQLVVCSHYPTQSIARLTTAVLHLLDCLWRLVVPLHLARPSGRLDGGGDEVATQVRHHLWTSCALPLAHIVPAGLCMQWRALNPLSTWPLVRRLSSRRQWPSHATSPA